MAITILPLSQPVGNPQDSSLVKQPSFTQSSKKRKPSQAWTYVQNQVSKPLRRPHGTVVVGLVLFIISAHRIMSIYMASRKWINAPITYIQRQCPSTSYEIMRDPSEAGKICITTLTDAKSSSWIQRFFRWRNYDGILELTLPNKVAYAAKHGYHLFDASNLIDPTRPPAWTKIRAVQHLIENEQCDWVLWTDADTVFMNSNVRVEDFLPQNSTMDMIVASDEGSGYNSGVFLFRNSEWSKEFLQKWWNMTSFVRPPGFSLSGDNNAMKALLASLDDFDSHVLVPPRCTINSFARFLPMTQSMSIINTLDQQEWYLNERFYHKGDFIAHTPGYDNKGQCLKLLLEEAI